MSKHYLGVKGISPEKMPDFSKFDPPPDQPLDQSQPSPAAAEEWSYGKHFAKMVATSQYFQPLYPTFHKSEKWLAEKFDSTVSELRSELETLHKLLKDYTEASVKDRAELRQLRARLAQPGETLWRTMSIEREHAEPTDKFATFPTGGGSAYLRPVHVPAPDKDAEEAIMRTALESIAANACCDKCQEAAKVAQDALKHVRKSRELSRSNRGSHTEAQNARP